MKKRSAVFKITLAVVLLFAVAVIGLYLIEIFVYKKSPTENLFKFLLTLCGLILCAARMISSTPKTSVYENIYALHIADAFENDKSSRKLLISAIADYDRDDISSALSKLKKLEGAAKTNTEQNIVYLFKALSCEDINKTDEAESSYGAILKNDPNEAVQFTVYNNMSRLYIRTKEYRYAVIGAEKALMLKPDEYSAINNGANAYFWLGNFVLAKNLALKSIKLYPDRPSPMSLLACVYTLENNFVEAKKYTDMSISLGVKKEDIDTLIKVKKEQMNAEKLFESKLESWKSFTSRSAVKIKTDGHGRSMLGGSLNESAPFDCNGDQMKLLAAVYCSELPSNDILPSYGILRFYISDVEEDTCAEYTLYDRKHAVIYSENESSLYPSEHRDTSEYFPVVKPCKISFSADSDCMPAYDFRFKDTYEAFASNEENAIYDNEFEEFVRRTMSYGNKIGGYPYFSGDDLRYDSPENNYDVLLFQLADDEDNDNGITVSCSGTCSFFISSEKLRAKDFSDVLYVRDLFD